VHKTARQKHLLNASGVNDILDSVNNYSIADDIYDQIEYPSYAKSAEEGKKQ
jgi:predicted nucleotidyltransferase